MFKHLLHSNTTKLEKALERTGAGLPNHHVLNHIYDPMNCPAHLLGWLAWHYSVDHWESDWPESIKRQVIKSSIGVHRKKGTVYAVKQALLSIELKTKINEWWQATPQLKPHTFELQFFTHINRNLGELAVYQRIIDVVNAVKPVRSHFTIRVTHMQGLRLSIGAGLSLHSTTNRESTLKPVPIRTSKQGLKMGTGLSLHNTANRNNELKAVPIRNTQNRIGVGAALSLHQTMTRSFAL